MTAEVYEWGHDKALKLYHKWFSNEWVEYEAKIGRIVHEAGVSSPAVFDTIDVDGRKGVLFQKIFGKPMLKQIEAEPWKLYYFAQQIAGFHIKIHKCSADNLPSQKERFAVSIGRSQRILGDRKRRILDYIESLPDGESVCHGDFHFNNIIVSRNDLIAVDWTNAYKGNPLGDVARTCMMISSPAASQRHFDAMNIMSQYVKWSTYWGYLNEYMRLSRVRLEDIDAWKLPVAAAKLKDKVPGEEKWLLNIIDKCLEQLDA